MPGAQYTISLYARSNVAVSHSLVIEWFTNSDYAARANGSATTGVASATPGASWTLYKGTVTVPSDATAMRFTLYGSLTGTTSDYIDVDAVMVTKGTTQYPFADGNTTNWVWDGTTNNSSSTGPALQ